MTRISARRAVLGSLWILGLVSLAIAAAILVTGGGRLAWANARVSLRTPQKPAFIGLASLFVWWILSRPAERVELLASAWRAVRAVVTSPARLTDRHASQLAPLLALAFAVGTLFLGIDQGIFEAGGSDSAGYLSQARLWLHGTLRLEIPLVHRVSWPFAIDVLTPLGFTASTDHTAIVPGFPPGLPLVMAAFGRLMGEHAVFYAVPTLGAIAVLATYVLGSRLAGPLTGLGAAALLATSPAFVYQLLAPMSDVPVTAWWALAFSVITFKGTTPIVAGGLACGAAILTRPNLAPLIVVPAGYLFYRDKNLRPALLFIAGALPGCLALAAFNHRLYGSPFASGYGDALRWYGVDYWLPNATRYLLWLWESQTGLMLLAPVAPLFLRWRRSRLGASEDTGHTLLLTSWWLFVAGVLASYLFYTVFDAWWYLRFLLPAFPFMLAFVSLSLGELMGVFGRPWVRRLGVAAVIGVVAWRNVTYLRNHNAFSLHESERKYGIVGRYVSETLPKNAVVFSKQHSGSIHYYAGRSILRIDWLPPDQLETVVVDLRRAGYHPYAVLEPAEVHEFRTRFHPHSTLGGLNWAPMAWHPPSGIRLYDLNSLESGQASPATEEIH